MSWIADHSMIEQVCAIWILTSSLFISPLCCQILTKFASSVMTGLGPDMGDVWCLHCGKFNSDGDDELSPVVPPTLAPDQMSLFRPMTSLSLKFRCRTIFFFASGEDFFFFEMSALADLSTLVSASSESLDVSIDGRRRLAPFKGWPLCLKRKFKLKTLIF